MNEVWKAIWESPSRWYTTPADAIMPMTDHFLTFYPSARMPPRHTCFLFPCFSQLRGSWRRPCCKTLRCSVVWETARFFIYLLFSSAAPFLSFSICLCWACSCQCSLLVINCPFFTLYSSVHFVPSLSVTWISIIPQIWGPGPNIFWFLLCHVCQPAWSESFSEKQTKHTPVRFLLRSLFSGFLDSCCSNRCQMRSVSSAGRCVFTLPQLLASGSWMFLTSCTDVCCFPFYVFCTLYSCPHHLVIHTLAAWHLSFQTDIVCQTFPFISKLWLLICPFCYDDL